jgi:hypothetical protein
MCVYVSLIAHTHTHTVTRTCTRATYLSTASLDAAALVVFVVVVVVIVVVDKLIVTASCFSCRTRSLSLARLSSSSVVGRGGGGERDGEIARTHDMCHNRNITETHALKHAAHAPTHLCFSACSRSTASSNATS